MLFRFAGGDLGIGIVNERDSSSWKYSVGNVSPLMRLIAIDPSAHGLSEYILDSIEGCLHQDEKEGGYTIREYIEVTGTEKA